MMLSLNNKMNMKRNFFNILVVTTYALSVLFMQGCGLTGQNDKETFRTIRMEEVVPLDAEMSASPTCKLTIDYQYLEVQNETDSITPRINEAVQSRLLGKEYALLPPSAAVDSFKNDYIRRYREDIIEFYREDLAKGTAPEDLPQWYNYEMNLITRFTDGYKDILNFTSETMEYTGGAHPNTWGVWLNFCKANGHIITLKDVLTEETLPQLVPLLTKKLIAEMAVRLEDVNICTVEDLKEHGILNMTNMYVSENFLLEADGMAFLYNRYDIAPYAVGDIELRLSYSEIEPYMNLKNKQ